MQNFGKIKNTFNNLLVEGIVNKTDENKNIFKKFIKTIKESNILKTQFNVYYDIEHKVELNDIKSSEFVKESISFMKQFPEKDILAENKKLINILKENNISIEDLDYPNSELHENISKLIFTKKNSKTIDTIVESLEKVISHVKQNVITENEKVWTDGGAVPNSLVGEIMLEKFNSKYSDLPKEDIDLISLVIESDEINRVKILNNLGGECVSLVNNKLIESNDLNEKEALLNVKETLLTLEYTNETFFKDVARLIELKKAFNV